MGENELRELQGQHDALLTAADTIRQRYSGAEQMSAEDAATFDRIMDDVDAIKGKIEKANEARRRDERLAGAQAFSRQPATEIHHAATTADAAAEAASDDRAKAEARTLFQKYLRGGYQGLSFAEGERLKAYQSGSDTEGGFLVIPEEFVNNILKGVDDQVVIRQLATVIQLPRAESLGVPTLDTDVNDADWTSELATGSLDEALRLGKRELTPHPLAKRTKMSRKLMRQARINPEALVQQRIEYKFGVTQERAFMTGNGAQKPLGLFTADSNGISTSRDVNTGNASDVTADGLINAAYTLKPQYWGRARWLMHRDVLKAIRKLKDASGNYIWASGISTRTEPTILDMPYIMSEFAPNTFSNGNYAYMLGDYTYYWIVEALDMQVQVLNELYAETNQIGYIFRVELDAAPVLEEAFVRGKFAV